MWFGEYSRDRAYTIWSKLRSIQLNLPFLGFTYDCNCKEAFPSEISKYTLQLWDRHSVADKSLAQSPTAIESGSVDPSGTSNQMNNRLNLSAWPAGAYGPSVLTQSA